MNTLPPLPPPPKVWNGFTVDAVHRLMTAARDIFREVQKSKSATNAPLLFVGDSPSWVFHAYKGLHLDRVYPAKQLPISGKYNVGTVWRNAQAPQIEPRHLQGYHKQVLEPMFPTGLPAKIWVVDSTSPGPGDLTSSVDSLQELLRVIAKTIYRQEVVPTLTLLRLVDRSIPETHMSQPRSVRTRNIWTQIPDTLLEPPRGCPEFRAEEWPKASKSRFGRTSLQKATDKMHQDRQYRQALNTFRGIIQTLPENRPSPLTAYAKKIQPTLGSNNTAITKRLPTSKWLDKRRKDLGRSPIAVQSRRKPAA